jgi:hypothetical protein
MNSIVYTYLKITLYYFVSFIMEPELSVAPFPRLFIQHLSFLLYQSCRTRRGEATKQRRPPCWSKSKCSRVAKQGQHRIGLPSWLLLSRQTFIPGQSRRELLC